MTDELLRFGITVDGDVEAKRAVDNVRKAIDQTADSAKKTEAPAKAVGASFNDLRNKGQQLTGGLNNIIGSLGGLSPEMAKASGFVARFTGGISGASAALGPWGIALGVATAALPLFIDYLGETASKADLITASFSKATQGLDAYIASARRAAEEGARAARIAGGGASADEAAGLAARAGGAVNQAGAALRTALLARGFTGEQAAAIISGGRPALERFAGEATSAANRSALNRPGLFAPDLASREGTIASIAPLLASLEANRAEQRRLQADASTRAFDESQIAQLGFVGPLQGGPATRGGGGGRQAVAPTAEELANQKIKLEQMAAELDALRDLTTAEEALTAAKLKGIDVELAAAEARAQFAQAVADKNAGDTSALRAAEAAAEQTARNLAIVDDAAQGVSDSLTGGFTDAISSSFGALIRGGEDAQQSFAAIADAAIEGIAVQAVSEALRQTALGISTAFVPGLQAESAAHFTAAGIWAGLAAGAGAASQASTASQGSGGGPQPGGAGSLSSGGGGGGSSEPTNIVVNINSPTDQAQIGQMTDAALRAGRRRFQARPDPRGR